MKRIAILPVLAVLIMFLQACETDSFDAIDALGAPDAPAATTAAEPPRAEETTPVVSGGVMLPDGALPDGRNLIRNEGYAEAGR